MGGGTRGSRDKSACSSRAFNLRVGKGRERYSLDPNHSPSGLQVASEYRHRVPGGGKKRRKEGYSHGGGPGRASGDRHVPGWKQKLHLRWCGTKQGPEKGSEGAAGKFQIPASRDVAKRRGNGH